MAHSRRVNYRSGGKLVLPGCARLEPHYAPRPLAPSRGATAPNDTRSDYPRISLVIPSLNQGQYIGQALESVINQNYPDLELIVVDGGSQDESIDVIKSYQGHVTSWVSELDTGQANAINKGMAQATGDILGWLNSDDCLMPNALHWVAHAFRTSPGADVVYGHRVLINEHGQDIGRWILPAHREFILKFVDFVPQETMFWTRKLWQKVGGELNESFRFAMDWELISRFMEAGASFKLVPAFLGQFRLHEMQKTQATIESEGFREMETIRQRWQLLACRNKGYREQLRSSACYMSLILFLLEARFTELLWHAGFKRID